MIKKILNKELKSILCLDGDIPEIGFFNSFKLPIIAADGAANKLLNIGINPDVIIGDLDSCDISLFKSSNIIKIIDQDSSDFYKSAEYMKSMVLFPSLVLGMNGGYIDHIINNINIFMDFDFVLYSAGVVGFVLKGKQELNLPLKSKISIFGLPFCKISTRGLKWELHNAELTFPGKNSCFNRTILDKVEISVTKGTSLIFVYTQPTSDAGLLC